MNTGRKTLLQTKIDQLKERQAEIAQEIEEFAASRNAELNRIADELTLLLNAQALLEGRPLAQFSSVATSLPEQPSVRTIERHASPNGDVDWSRFDVSSIEGLTKEKALAKMAEWAGGTIRVKDIGQVLIDGGQSSQKTATDAARQSYSALTTSRLFRRSGRGEYSLVGR